MENTYEGLIKILQKFDTYLHEFVDIGNNKATKGAFKTS